MYKKVDLAVYYALLLTSTSSPYRPIKDMMANKDISVETLYKTWKTQVNNARTTLKGEEAISTFGESWAKECLANVAKRDSTITTAMHNFRHGKVAEHVVRAAIQEGLEGLASFF